MSLLKSTRHPRSNCLGLRASGMIFALALVAVVAYSVLMRNANGTSRPQVHRTFPSQRRVQAALSHATVNVASDTAVNDRIVSCAEVVQRQWASMADADDIPLRGRPLPAEDNVTVPLIWPTPTGNVSMGIGVQHLHFARFSLAFSPSMVPSTNDDVMRLAFQRLCIRLFPVAGVAPTPARNTPFPTAAAVRMIVSVEQPDSTLNAEMDEGYELAVGGDADMTLTSKTVWGALRGLETFWQTVTQGPSADMATVMAVPYTITDRPAQHWRGVLLDTSRHFQPIADIKRLLYACAMAKFNVFHWHIVDQQASHRHALVAADRILAPQTPLPHSVCVVAKCMFCVYIWICVYMFVGIVCVCVGIMCVCAKVLACEYAYVVRV